MFEQHRVAVLAVLLAPGRLLLQSGLCPTCGRLSTDGGRTCPLDGAPLAPVDALEYIVHEAARQTAQVVIVRDHCEWLRNHGGIAALLRW